LLFLVSAPINFAVCFCKHGVRNIEAQFRSAKQHITQSKHITLPQILRRSTKKAVAFLCYGFLIFCSESTSLFAFANMEFETLRHSFALRNNT